MLERRGRWHAESRLQFLNQLPTVEGIAQIDKSRRSVEHLQRELGAKREQLRGFLVRVGAVAQRELGGAAARVLLSEVVGDGVVVEGSVVERLQWKPES